MREDEIVQLGGELEQVHKTYRDKLEEAKVRSKFFIHFEFEFQFSRFLCSFPVEYQAEC